MTEILSNESGSGDDDRSASGGANSSFEEGEKP
jgi:hypothetical protein